MSRLRSPVFCERTVRTSSSIGARWGRSRGRPYSALSRSRTARSRRRAVVGLRVGTDGNLGAGGRTAGVVVAEREGEVAGLQVHGRGAPREGEEPPILYLHGVPTASWEWIGLLERVGGVAPDLPGFGRSAKPGDFDYSIDGYDRFLEAFCDVAGLERLSLVVHDWGGVGLAFAQRFPERIERLVLFSCVPFLPGYRWHRIARIWRKPLLGELFMGFSTRFAMRRSMGRELADRIWPQFD